MKHFEYPVRVYFSDTDAGGIVYHGRYLDFAEHARTEMLRSVSGDDQSRLLLEDIAFVVKSINVSYELPGYLDDLLTVHTEIKEMGRFSCIYHQEVKRGDELLCVVETKVGCISLSRKRPSPIPSEIIQALS